MFFIYTYTAAMHLINVSLSYCPHICTLDIMKFTGDLIGVMDIVKQFFTGYYHFEQCCTMLSTAKVAK